jgi:hypothetical protein
VGGTGLNIRRMSVIEYRVDGIPVLERKLADGRILNVYPLLLGRARLGIARPEFPMSYDNVW